MSNLFYYVVSRFANIVRLFQISYILDSYIPNEASYHVILVDASVVIAFNLKMSRACS